jgi:hypothetical protein
LFFALAAKRYAKKPTSAAFSPYAPFAVGFPADRENTWLEKRCKHEINLSWPADKKNQLRSPQIKLIASLLGAVDEGNLST